MDALKCIESRRSVRKFSAAAVEREVIEQTVAAAAWAPSWKNTQTSRYVAVTDRELIENIAQSCVMGLDWNTKIISGAPALMALATVTGRSGYERDGSFSTSLGGHWESFDAGIAAQTFCLAAWERGLGTVILGVFDHSLVEKALGLPENMRVSALIALGWPEGQPSAPPRKAVSELLSWR